MTDPEDALPEDALPEDALPEDALPDGRDLPDGREHTLAALGAHLARAVRDTGAYGGGLYLLPPGEKALQLAVMTGLPTELAGPWLRVGLAAPVPAAEAVRRRTLIWLGDQHRMARLYPRAGMGMPYSFASATAPVLTPSAVHGVIVLLWPDSRPADLSPAERARITGACDRLARLLERAAHSGRPVLPEPDPVTVPLPAPPGGEALPAGRESGGRVVAESLERLPEGLCSLDPAGHITHITRRGAELVGETADRLLGTRPWRSLPWLYDPVYEDRYRAALMSRRPTSFVALRPPDSRLFFELYPDATGITVRIRPVRAGEDGPAPRPDTDPAAQTRPGALYHLMHLAGALTEAVGAQDVLDRTAEQIAPAFGARALALAVAEGGRLRVIGRRGFRADTMDRLDGTPLDAPTPGARTVATGLPSFFSTRQELERAHPARRGVDDGMAAWAFLPLVVSGRPVGLCVLGFARPHAFTTDERAVLTSLCGFIAQALDRARLYDTKHRIAHGLQTSLLPHALPVVPGLEVAARYLPGTRGMDIGGDFYDLVRIDGTTLGAVIGDVQGHNVTAAALMGQVRTAVRAFAASGADPAEVLDRTNRLLTGLDPGLFASCLYLRLDLREQRAAVASAGHPPALLRGPGGGTGPLGTPACLLLGVEPEAEYRSTVHAWPRGSVLVLYTDGLVETSGLDLDRGTAELAGRIERSGDRPAEELADVLAGSALRSAVRSDDIALLILRPGA